MWRVSKVMRQVAMVVCVVLLLLFSPTGATGQYGQQVYVCQTPTFWCAVPGPVGAQNGTSCWCSTYWGPVWGASIDPSGVPNAPKLPAPQAPQQPPNQSPPRQDTPVDVGADDCYKGLGNCQGSFVRTARDSGASPGSSEGSRRSTSSFGAALKRLIDAADDGFESVKGRATKGSSASDQYDSTVIPSGLESCTIFVPKNRRRSPWLACWPHDDTTVSQVVRLVTDALGREHSRDADEHLWVVGAVEISVDRTDKTVNVRLR